jgi:Trk K+ transport system NAD-binding subunit
VIPGDLADLLLLVVALSMLLTPLLFITYDRVIAPRYADAEEREADDMPHDSKIIIAGAGRIGGIVERILTAAGHNATMIDYSSRRLQIMERFGFKHYFGDATRPDLLAAAGIGEAKLFIVAIDDRDQISELVKYVCATYPNLPVVARAVDRDHVYDLWAHGCRNIIRETYDSSLRIGRSALEELGLPRDTAQEVVNLFDTRDREALLKIATVHKPGVPPADNPDYVAAVREMRGDWITEIQKDAAEIIAARRGSNRGLSHAETRTGAPAGRPRNLGPASVLSVHAHRLHVVLARDHEGELAVIDQRQLLPVGRPDGVERLAIPGLFLRTSARQVGDRDLADIDDGPGHLDPGGFGIAFCHVTPTRVDLDRLHDAVRHRTAQVDMQQPMLHRWRPRPRPRRPGRSCAGTGAPRSRDGGTRAPVLLGLAAAHDKLAVLHGDRQITLAEPRHGQRDAIRVLAALFDIVGRVAVVSGLRGPFHEALQLIEPKRNGCDPSVSFVIGHIL